MKYTVPALMIIGLLISSCKNNPSSKPVHTTTAKDSVAAQPVFFPVPEYIGGQLKMIDSLQLPLNIAVTVNNKTVSRIATSKELLEWALGFQHPDISDPALKDQYTETNIADQSVPSVTFIYATRNTALPVQKINVFIKPNPSENDKVTGIYMEKLFMVHDTIFNQKLYWKTGKNLQVITEKKINAVTLPVEQVKITWDPSE